MSRRAVTIVEAILLGISAAVGAAHADSYPERPIKIVVPTTAGSGPDVTARVVAERLSVSMGQAIVIQNRPGAIGTIVWQAQRLSCRRHPHLSLPHDDGTRGTL